MLPLKQARHQVRVETIAERHDDTGTREVEALLPFGHKVFSSPNEIDTPPITGQERQRIMQHLGNHRGPPVTGIMNGNAERDVTTPAGRWAPRRMVAELNGGADDERVVHRWVPAGQAVRFDAFGVELQVFVNRAPDPTSSGGSPFLHNVDTAFGNERDHGVPNLTTTTRRRRFQSSCAAPATSRRQRVQCNAAPCHSCRMQQWRRRCGS